MTKFISFQFADRCAWRAIYVSVNGRQVFYIGVDPSMSRGPQAFGGFGRRSWRLRLPTVAFRYPASPLRRWAYARCSQFWTRLDGRSRSR